MAGGPVRHHLLGSIRRKPSVPSVQLQTRKAKPTSSQRVTMQGCVLRTGEARPWQGPAVSRVQFIGRQQRHSWIWMDGLMHKTRRGQPGRTGRESLSIFRHIHTSSGARFPCDAITGKISAADETIRWLAAFAYVRNGTSDATSAELVATQAKTPTQPPSSSSSHRRRAGSFFIGGGPECRTRARGGHGQGCGGGQQEEKPEADAGSGCEGQAKEKAAKGNEKDKEKAGGGCKDEKADKDKAKGCGGGGGGKDEKGGKDKDKKAPPPLPVVTAVLKIDMHCDGCAHRIRASVRRFPGVEGVAMEVDKGSMTVVGRFDAKKLRDRVAAKTRKKVELVGGKDNKGGGGGDKNKCADGEGKQEPDKKEEEKKEQDDKCGGNAGKGKGGKDNKKPAVPVIVTVVLKIGSAGLHCDGCMHRIRCKLFKIKGVEQVKMDPAKNQVTVTGTMDAKALPEKLRKKLRRPVDVVPPGKGDKDKEKEKEKDGCNKDGKQQQQGQGDGKQGGDGKQCKEAAEKALAAELQLWKTAFYDQQAMQATEFLLSDENPNACAVM
ncbi:heavy metal-associated isoprenylated plant protein 7-like [Hordeum vulgare subsp. vulgare]|uniref:heavy metal-associated isoprenylated plant protein 7-like n=1 Tax=Hordeum vulgare subsp. vulgare TaxID=112509 RepID=UPI001D1A3E00|nr:heavy metal-associated isoprenylated plant protein 7-like [Hordeum vulgare subsp. vulgare]